MTSAIMTKTDYVGKGIDAALAFIEPYALAGSGPASINLAHYAGGCPLQGIAICMHLN